MASNPIKRRARQSFFLGFLIALVAMAIVVMLLFSKINALNEENAKLKVKGPEVSVFTITREVQPGEQISMEDLQPSTMQLSVNSGIIDTSNYIKPEIFSKVDEETGEEVEVNYSAKVLIPEGSVVTLSMLQEGGVANDERLMEYGMIVLPSQLKNGDYIDIRLRLANGSEEVVLSKKRVEQCTTNSIWMKMREIEILTMNAAIVDAYLAQGSQLRATVYTDPLMQEAAVDSYAVNDDVLKAITYNENILVEAKNALIAKWYKTSDENAGATDYRVERRTIENYYTELTQEQRASTMDAAYTEEASTINNARNNYVSALEGTGVVGTTY